MLLMCLLKKGHRIKSCKHYGEVTLLSKCTNEISSLKIIENLDDPTILWLQTMQISYDQRKKTHQHGSLVMITYWQENTHNVSLFSIHKPV